MKKLTKNKIWRIAGFILSCFIGVWLIRCGFFLFYEVVIYEGAFTIQQGINLIGILVSWEIVKLGIRLIQPDFELEEMEQDFQYMFDKFNVKYEKKR